jgi:hypothetical protein
MTCPERSIDPKSVILVEHTRGPVRFVFTAHGSDLHRERRMLREKVARVIGDARV